MLEQVDQKDSIPVHLKLNLTLKEADEYSNIGIKRLSIMIYDVPIKRPAAWIFISQ